VKNKNNSAVTGWIKQSNLLTLASSSWTLVERRMFYIILYHLQFLKYEKVQENIRVEINIAWLSANVSNISQAVTAIRSLKSKNVEITTNMDYIIVGIINYAKFSFDKKKIEVEISHLAVPYLLDLSTHYTQYELSVALSFKSVYSQKLYELCCQFKNNKQFSMTIDELLRLFNGKEKYQSEDFYNLKRRCIFPAYIEIKESNSDVYFEFKPIAERGGKKITRIVFTVVCKGKPNVLVSYVDYLWYVDTQLEYYFGKRDAALVRQIKFILVEHRDWIERFVEKLERIVSLYKTKKDVANVLRKMILDDYIKYC
jgi:hypothetical protein